jgi:hypothetical protein
MVSLYQLGCLGTDWFMLRLGISVVKFAAISSRFGLVRIRKQQSDMISGDIQESGVIAHMCRRTHSSRFSCASSLGGAAITAFLDFI